MNTSATTKPKAARKVAATPTNVVAITKPPSQRKPSKAATKAAIVKLDAEVAAQRLADELAKNEPAIVKTAKRTKATKVVEPAAPVAAKPTMSDEQRDQLIAQHAVMVQAVDAFELLVVELLEQGVSPSHVGAAVELGNSSVRRILWRRKPELAPKS